MGNLTKEMAKVQARLERSLEDRPTADMIDMVEIDDAIRNYRKVEARVREVAFIVAELKNEFAGVESPKWEVDRFSFSDAADIEPQCHVTFSVRWFDRPKTERYGDPEDDDDSNGYSRSSERLTRHVVFPTRYLTTAGWEAEEEKRARNSARTMLRLNIDYMKKDLEDQTRALKEAKMKLEYSERRLKDMGDAED